MEKVGIIDIGSNSVRMIVFEIVEQRSYKLIDDLKETVRLGDDVVENGRIGTARLNRVLTVLRTFRNYCQANDIVRVIAVATAALRKADNHLELLPLLSKELGTKIDILSAKEEAYYVYWGVANSFDLDDALIVDVGGGSIELILMKNKGFHDFACLPFGSLDLTRNFGLAEDYRPKKNASLKSFLRETLSEIAWFKGPLPKTIIAVGGSARTLGKISRQLQDYPLDISHNYIMDKNELFKISNTLISSDHVERRNLPGLSASRADIIVGPAVFLKLLFKECGADRFVISGSGLREGLLFEHFKDILVPNHRDVLDSSLKNALFNWGIKYEHAHQVYTLFIKLIRSCPQLKSKGDLDLEKVCKCAAYLHDSGSSLRYYNHHEHSFYMILNSGIYGLNHRELLFSAYLAGLHRNKKLKQFALQRENLLLRKADKKLLEKLSVLLYIAEHLDRSRDSAVKRMDISDTEDKYSILLTSDEKLDFAISNALSIAPQFQKLFGKRLSITKTDEI